MAKAAGKAMQITNSNYAEAIEKGWFATATYVRLYDLPGVTALPAMPAATYVRLENLPGVTALPAMPAATYVWLYDLPGVTVLPAMPAATDVRLENLPGVTARPTVATRGRVYRDGNLWTKRAA